MKKINQLLLVLWLVVSISFIWLAIQGILEGHWLALTWLVISLILFFALRTLHLKSRKQGIKSASVTTFVKELVDYIGKENIQAVSCCSTRVKLQLKDANALDLDKIRAMGIAGVIRPSNSWLHLITKEKTADVMALLEQI